MIISKKVLKKLLMGVLVLVGIASLGINAIFLYEIAFRGYTIEYHGSDQYTMQGEFERRQPQCIEEYTYKNSNISRCIAKKVVSVVNKNNPGYDQQFWRGMDEYYVLLENSEEVSRPLPALLVEKSDLDTFHDGKLPLISPKGDFLFLTTTKRGIERVYLNDKILVDLSRHRDLGHTNVTFADYQFTKKGEKYIPTIRYQEDGKRYEAVFDFENLPKVREIKK